ncbi:exosome complex component RRP46 [[Emmonsia] crescens]|uniref:Exosome complex component RRP46 n=1 Tax=[Emmonsia] crescens TaxID=73230 RepID=A0A2B7ZH18_9EURO|nr:exosome complex component RRP46 [Emmonsia crescens]
MASPIASLAPLYFPDGSASYTSPNGDQILGSVNGPIEAGRRDAQKPEEATIGVVVKSGVGISGVGERYVEGILRGILSRVILVREKSMPRKGIVITLVVLKNTGADGKVAERGGSCLPILPSLLHTALLALLSAAIPLSMIYTSALVAVSRTGELVQNPSNYHIKTAQSLHVLVFSSKGHLLLNESEGEFDLDTWDKVYELAQYICRGCTGLRKEDGDVDMDGIKAGQTLEQFVRDTVEDKIREDLAWKIATT